MRLRPYEWLIVVFFVYVGAIAPFLIPHGAARWQPALVAGIVAGILLAFTRTQSVFRDWVPIGFTLAAYREMNCFTPAVRDHHLERGWIVWDRWLLDTHHCRAAVEIAGALLPSLLEICYLTVYAVAPLALVVLLLNHRRDRMGVLWFAYLAGTLASYALFPYFPSDPPRTVFAGADLPHVITIFRRFNLAILGQYGIHSSVFPSAHVSSAFACAWGLLVAMPEHKRYGWIFAGYALLVAIATVYGRYHFAADAAAGFAMSFLAFFAARLPRTRV